MRCRVHRRSRGVPSGISCPHASSADRSNIPIKRLRHKSLLLRFSGQRLDKIETAAGHAPLNAWRLEPKRLAEWSAGSKTARVQVRVSELRLTFPMRSWPSKISVFFSTELLTWSASDAPCGSICAPIISVKVRAPSRSNWRARYFSMSIAPGGGKFLEAALALYLEIRFSKPQIFSKCISIKFIGGKRVRTIFWE